MNRAQQEFEPIWAAGFMTGTSVDAVDGAMILTDGEEVFGFGPVVERSFAAPEREIVMAAVEAARAWNWIGPEPETAFRAAEALAVTLHGEAMAALLEAAGGIRPDIVGVHGQTVLHRAPGSGQSGATRQIIDAPAMARALAMPTVCDFRSADVASGGQGAPLAPAYHAALMARLGEGPMAVLNLGGVANITARMADGSLIAFDTGPANGPIDQWVALHDRGVFDKDGAAAALGRCDEGRLAEWLDHSWFDAPPPKSLDRFDFDATLARGLSFEDGAAALTALSAHAVARAFEHLPDPPVKLIVTGGGRRNRVLMAMLSGALPCQVLKAEQVGWRGDSIEAEAFALLAVRHLRGLPISWPATTGVPEPMTGGRLIQPIGLVPKRAGH